MEEISKHGKISLAAAKSGMGRNTGNFSETPGGGGPAGRSYCRSGQGTGRGRVVGGEVGGSPGAPAIRRRNQRQSF
jgi:hypothetical protein